MWQLPPSLGGNTIKFESEIRINYNEYGGDGEKIIITPLGYYNEGAPRSYTIKRTEGIIENKNISGEETFSWENLMFRNVKIFPDAIVLAHGDNSVRLLPQFHAYYGSNVHISAGGNGLQANNALLNAKAPADVSGVVDEPQTGFSQNYPNPCSVNTMIDCCLPEVINEAFLYVVSSTGRVVRNISISERGSHVLNLDVSGLPLGLYSYYVVADGKMLGSKRMAVAHR